jgi:uncharacterized protein YbjQ (UPF0145 family)
MNDRTVQSTQVERDIDKVKDKYGGHAQHYAETRAEAAEAARADRDADHWQAVADKLEQGE